MKAMFRNTAYIFTKFIQIIRFVKREGKKIQQLYMLYKVLQVAGRAAIVSSILSVILLYSRIKPMICLYMNVDCKNYIKTILTPTEGNVKKIEKSSRTVIREYRAAL